MEHSADEFSARPPRTIRTSRRRTGAFATLVVIAGCAVQVDGVDEAVENGEPATAVHTQALCSGSNVTLTASPASPQPSGMLVKLAAQASCGSSVPVEYDFSYRLSTSTTWTRLRAWSTNRFFGWNTTGIAPGTYNVRVAAREQGTTSVAVRVITYQLSVPPASECPGASVIRNIPYGAHALQKLDLHVAPGSTPRPLLVVIHGGGWRCGNKSPLGSDLVNRVCPLVSEGYAVAAINYRLTCIPSACGESCSFNPSCEDHMFPKQIHDAKAAVRFLRANAEGYGFNANRIISWGFSAGGHLSALLGTSAGVAELEDQTIGDYPGVSSAVNAFIDCAGPTRLETMDAELGVSNEHNDACSAESQLIGCEQGLQTNCDPSKLADVSPLTYVNGDEPPALIGHGERDPVVPPQQSYHLRDALLREQRPVTYREAADKLHDVGACPTITQMRQFLSTIP